MAPRGGEAWRDVPGWCRYRAILVTRVEMALPLDDRAAASAGKTKPNRLVPGLV